MESREAFIAIKRKIKFQQSDKEKYSHYTILGNTMVRISNHCTWLYVWDNYLEKHPNCKSMNIVSIVFEDNGNTYSPECLYLKRQRQTPIVVTEYIYKSASITKPAILQIISSLQKMDITNRYDENTGLAVKK